MVLAIVVGALGRALPARVPGKGIRPKKRGEGRPFSVKLPELPNLTRLKGGKMRWMEGRGASPDSEIKVFLRVLEVSVAEIRSDGNA